MIHDDPSMNYSDRDVFTNDFVKHNLPFYNFIHHLLFGGWADNDCYTSPGSGSPFRGQLLGEGKDKRSSTAVYRHAKDRISKMQSTLPDKESYII